MKNKWVSLVKSAVAVACLATASVNAFAMPMLVESDGQVIGINGLVVGLEIYHVQFVEGSCDSLFSGCDESLFTFTTSDSARTAAESILSAFVGHPVDDFPELQFGIESERLGLSLIPFARPLTSGVVGISLSVNWRPGIGVDGAQVQGILPSRDTSDIAGQVYATFQRATPVVTPPAVPTPASLLLALVGLAGMRLQHKRQLRQV